MASVTLNHIYKVYNNNTKAVNDFNLEIKDKEFIVFVGPSGCGKSTTLRMIAGLEEISSGQLKIDQKIVNDLEPKERDIAMVFQNYALYPHMTVYDNMGFGLRIKKIPKDIIHTKIIETAEILGITEYLDHKPKEMSGGQRQRVALGRAILREPKVFLLDEPLSNLDAKLRTQMRAEILKIYKKLNTTFIYVTHDQVEAMTMGTRIVVMNKGILQQVDTPKNLYNFPINKFVAGFIGTPQMNFLNGMLTIEDSNGIFKIDNTEICLKIPKKFLLKIDHKYKNGNNQVILGIRCENIIISNFDDTNSIKLKIMHLEELGDESLVYGNIDYEDEEYDLKKAKLILKTSSKVNLEIGQIVCVTFDFENIHLFDYKSEKSIISRIPNLNIINGYIINHKLKILSNEILLPNTFKSLPEQTYQISIPIDAIEKGDKINSKIINIEKIDNEYLLYLKIDNKIIFAKTKEEYNIDDEYKFSIDLKKLSFSHQNSLIKSPLPLINKVEAQFVKEKYQKKFKFYFILNQIKILIPDFICEQIFSSLNIKAFETNFLLSFSPYDYEIENNGIDVKVNEIIDYNKEKFIKTKVNDKIIYLYNKYDYKENYSFKFLPNFNKIHIEDIKNNIKII